MGITCDLCMVWWSRGNFWTKRSNVCIRTTGSGYKDDISSLPAWQKCGGNHSFSRHWRPCPPPPKLPPDTSQHVPPARQNDFQRSAHPRQIRLSRRYDHVFPCSDELRHYWLPAHWSRKASCKLDLCSRQPTREFLTLWVHSKELARWRKKAWMCCANLWAEFMDITALCNRRDGWHFRRRRLEQHLPLQQSPPPPSKLCKPSYRPSFGRGLCTLA